MFEDVIMETFTTISTDLSSTVVELKVREEGDTPAQEKQQRLDRMTHPLTMYLAAATSAWRRVSARDVVEPLRVRRPGRGLPPQRVQAAGGWGGRATKHRSVTTAEEL